MKGIIYKMTNMKNSKIYVGQTTASLEERLKGHVKRSRSKRATYIGRAINKYGLKGFIIEQIDTPTTINELNQKEIYWIQKCNCVNHMVIIWMLVEVMHPPSMETRKKISEFPKKKISNWKS